MESFPKKLMDNQWTTVVYFTVVLLLLVLMTWFLWRISPKTERLIGSGITDQVFTSGATMRRLAQEFTSTDQGQPSTVYNANIVEAVPGILGSGKERLVSGREAPVFYEIGRELETWQGQSAGQMKADVAAGKTSAERFTESPINQMQDEILRMNLYQL